MKYLVFCMWEPIGEQKWTIMPNYTDGVLNAGKPWLCFESGKGLTGLVGMQVEADTEDEAKIKMSEVIEDYKRKDKEPNVWH
jgi:hypothetical protein